MGCLHPVPCSFLSSVSAAGEHAQEFLELFRTLIEDPAGQWKSYLALRGALPKIGALIDKVSSSEFCCATMFLAFFIVLV